MQGYSTGCRNSSQADDRSAHHGDVDLSSPLRSISPGLDSAVLKVLARTESGLSASQIARLSSRGTRAGQHPVLNRLVEHGLVSAEVANTGFLYRLNREHVLTSAVLAAVAARQTILTRLTAAVLQMRPEPVHVCVFGSFAVMRPARTATSTFCW